MTNNNEDLGGYLRRKREAADLTIRQLARLVDVDHGYIVRLEGGQKTNPSAELLQRIADVLDIDASELLAYIGVKPSSVMPPADVFFRNAYGLSEDDAKEAAALIEQRYGKKNRTVDKEGGET